MSRLLTLAAGHRRLTAAALLLAVVSAVTVGVLWHAAHWGVLAVLATLSTGAGLSLGAFLVGLAVGRDQSTRELGEWTAALREPVNAGGAR